MFGIFQSCKLSEHLIFDNDDDGDDDDDDDENGFPKAFYFLHLILSGMRERRQFVRVNDKTTELVDLQFGVPQGSILRPVLINSYANDLNDIDDCTV